MKLAIYEYILLLLALGVRTLIATPVLQDVAPEGRLVNGHFASPKQFPYQAGLLLYKADGEDWCGGTIISDRWVVTAAQCTYDVTDGIDLYLGVLNRLDKTEAGRQILFIERKYIIVHEDYVPGKKLADISLVKTPARIAFNDYIRPAILPDRLKPYFAHSRALATGWGSTNTGGTGSSDKLIWIRGEIMADTRCMQYYVTLNADQICMTANDQAYTCKGDTGGPLVLDNDTNTLVGITTFNKKKCSSANPMKFIRVTYYILWIEKHTGVTPPKTFATNTDPHSVA